MPKRGEPFELRPVGEDCLDELLGVYTACEDFLALTPTPAASPEMVRSDLRISQSEGGIFSGVYLQGGEIAGVLDFVPGNYHGERGAAYIALLMIKKEFRNRGIGAGVVEHIESEFRKNPEAVRIRAGVMVNNPDAVRFWKARGFAVVSGPKPMTDGTMVYDLEKKIR